MWIKRGEHGCVVLWCGGSGCGYKLGAAWGQSMLGGRSMVKQLACLFNQPGWFGELSGALEHVACRLEIAAMTKATIKLMI